MSDKNSTLFPSPSQVDLLKAFQGMQLHSAPAPAVIIDRAVVERNCQHMLEACQFLDVDFRAHTKTHKVNTGTLPSLPLSPHRNISQSRLGGISF